jgi:hypothetical protein
MPNPFVSIAEDHKNLDAFQAVLGAKFLGAFCIRKIQSFTFSLGARAQVLKKQFGSHVLEKYFHSHSSPLIGMPAPKEHARRAIKRAG